MVLASTRRWEIMARKGTSACGECASGRRESGANLQLSVLLVPERRLLWLCPEASCSASRAPVHWTKSEPSFATLAPAPIGSDRDPSVLPKARGERRGESLESDTARLRFSSALPRSQPPGVCARRGRRILRAPQGKASAL